MSDFQHRAMHRDHEGHYTAAIHTGHHHGLHSSHATTHHHSQAAVMDHCLPSCPYEEKIIQNGAVARMVLMFIRELVEQSFGQPRQSYGCPMSRCHRLFTGPLQLIQHLLSCPEVPSGEFDCDRCNHWHTFPTNDKDWEQWQASKGQQTPQGHVRRKQSLGSKIKGFALSGKKDSRKPNHLYFKSECSMDSRPSTAASEASSTFTNRCADHHVIFPSQGNGTAFANVHKPPILPALVSPIDGGGLFWPGFDAEQICDMTSTEPSIVSTLDISPSKPISQNTSQTTLFTPSIAPSLGAYNPPVTSVQGPNDAMAQQYLFSQPAFNHGSTPLTQPASSAMVLDHPLPIARPSLSISDLRPSTSNNSHGWWSNKLGMHTSSQQTPSTSGPQACFHLQAPVAVLDRVMDNSGLTTPTSPNRHQSPLFQMSPASAHPMSRADSMQAQMATMYNTPAAESQLDAVSPQTEHDHHSVSGHRKNNFDPTPEELVCDECQWKPRGVRENLKGYLRKHKNTHKGLRLHCDIENCTKTFSRLDNLKKHKKDKHGIEDPVGVVPSKRVADDYAEHIEDETTDQPKRPATLESEIRGIQEDYSMLWPALHF
ncbi:hypothetical protein QBC35DRAFT_395622 [Podospora australis]|uniref:C2H2-type domain-containing protein n=1 Tax=Podospora australis TaxID=1536484 RepID=A0AAN6WM06_9PEZI|nr:hypothetical protein QBC35DRAFT_395622 [Podospora australis]